MATTQGYQQVVVVPTVASYPQARSDFLRKGVRIGGLAIGLPCVIYLSVAGIIFIISAISILSVDSMFDDFDSHFSDDFNSAFDSNNETLNTVGIIILLVGIGLIIASIVLCCVGHREYKKFMQGDAGRVINTNPSSAMVAGSYPMTSNAYTPNIAQVSPYPSPGGQQPATYQPPVAGQMAPQMMYPGAPREGQLPYASPPPAPSSGQMPYPAALLSGQMPYPSPTTAGQMPYASSLEKTPYPTGPGPAIAQVPPYSGQQQYATNSPYQAQAPDFQETSPGLLSKENVPGEVVPEYERPPPYAP